MQHEEYHKRIVDYYSSTEHAYRDSWDLDKSLAIHYGYWDKQVKSFPASLARMNEVMIEAAEIAPGDNVLDAGCGVGGSSLAIAARGATVIGITLSERQRLAATENAGKQGLEKVAQFEVMDYCHTRFAENSFDVVWGCESICYATDKKQFIKEAFRVLKPGGRLVVADGFVTKFEFNDHPVVRSWLDGWQVNYLESPARFWDFMNATGFTQINFRDISRNTLHSSRRLYKIYYLASLYLIWKKLSFSNRASAMQKSNIAACKHQYRAMKKGLWQYGLFTGLKPR